MFSFSPESATESLCNELLTTLNENPQLSEFKCEQWEERPAYKKLQEKIKKFAWIKTIRVAIQYSLTTKYNRAKLILVGQGAAGKTSTAFSLLGRKFNPEYISTIVGNADVQIDLYDVLDWREREVARGKHLMEEDFRDAVNVISKDKFMIDIAEQNDTSNIPAVNSKIINYVSTGSQKSTSTLGKSNLEASTVIKNEVIQPVSNEVVLTKQSLPSKSPFKKIRCYLKQKVLHFRRTGTLLKNQNGHTDTHLVLSTEKNVNQNQSKDIPLVSSEQKNLNSPSLTVWDFGGQKVFFFFFSL